MDKSQRHYAKWISQSQQITYSMMPFLWHSEKGINTIISTHMAFRKKGNYWVKKQISGYQKFRRGRIWLQTVSKREISGDVRIVLHFVHVGKKLSFKLLMFSTNEFEKMLTVSLLNLWIKRTIFQVSKPSQKTVLN